MESHDLDVSANFWTKMEFKFLVRISSAATEAHAGQIAGYKSNLCIFLIYFLFNFSSLFYLKYLALQIASRMRINRLIMVARAGFEPGFEPFICRISPTDLATKRDQPRLIVQVREDACLVQMANHCQL